MQCKVNNRLTPPEVRNTTPEEEESMEDTKAEEGVKEDLAEVEDRSYAITMDNNVTLHETARRLPATTIKPSITLLNSAQCCLPRFKRSNKIKMSNSLELIIARQIQL